MWFSENRLVWDDKAPEGSGEAVDAKAKSGVEVPAKPDVPAATQEARTEVQALTREVAPTVAATATKEDEQVAEDVAASVTPPGVDTPLSEESIDPEEVEKEEFGKNIKKVIALIIAYFVGSKVGSSEAIDAERATLVTAYQGVVDKLGLPVSVEEADIGVLKGQEIEDAAQLEAFLNGKAKVEGLTAKVSLRDYLNKLKKAGSSAAPAAAAPTGDTATPAVEAAPTAPASPFANCPDCEIDMTNGASCSFELASGGEVVLDGKRISTGGRTFEVQATTSEDTAQVSFDKIWPIAGGGYGLKITPMIAGIKVDSRSKNVPLPQDKVVALVRALVEGGKQDKFTYDVVNPADGKTVKFDFEKV